jgi:hypothetical protein
MSTKYSAYFSAPCICKMDGSGDVHVFIKMMDGVWYQTSEGQPVGDATACTLDIVLGVKPTKPKRRRVPLLAIGPNGEAEHFPPTAAAECAGHDRRNIHRCRNDRQRTHHGRRWQEAG